MFLLLESTISQTAGAAVGWPMVEEDLVTVHAVVDAIPPKQFTSRRKRRELIVSDEFMEWQSSDVNYMQCILLCRIQK